MLNVQYSTFKDNDTTTDNKVMLFTFHQRNLLYWWKVLEVFLCLFATKAPRHKENWEIIL